MEYGVSNIKGIVDPVRQKQISRSVEELEAD
jgi:hypothetical protein